MTGTYFVQPFNNKQTRIYSGSKNSVMKLLVGERLHKRESKYDECCWCSCWANYKADDYLLKYSKRCRHQNEIYHAIHNLGKEMDLLLHNILRDGIGKYLLNGNKQSLMTKINLRIDDFIGNYNATRSKLDVTI